MLKFLTYNEIYTFLPKTLLDNLIQSYDENIDTSETDYSILDSLEEFAIAEVDGYLSASFDIEFMIQQKSNALLKQMVIDIMIYNLFCQCSPASIPEHRSDRYHKTIKMLQDIGKGTFSPAYFTQRAKTDSENTYHSFIAESTPSYIYNL